MYSIVGTQTRGIPSTWEASWKPSWNWAWLSNCTYKKEEQAHAQNRQRGNTAAVECMDQEPGCLRSNPSHATEQLWGRRRVLRLSGSHSCVKMEPMRITTLIPRGSYDNETSLSSMYGTRWILDILGVPLCKVCDCLTTMLYT